MPEPEPEPEPEGERVPPSKPSALKVQKAEHDRRAAAFEVRRYLESLPPETAEAREGRTRRANLTSTLFLGCPQIASAETLALYVDASREFNDDVWRRAWIGAFADQDRTFAPPPKAIATRAKELTTADRKRARKATGSHAHA